MLFDAKDENFDALVHTLNLLQSCQLWDELRDKCIEELPQGMRYMNEECAVKAVREWLVDNNSEVELTGLMQRGITPTTVELIRIHDEIIGHVEEAAKEYHYDVVEGETPADKKPDTSTDVLDAITGSPSLTYPIPFSKN